MLIEKTKRLNNPQYRAWLSALPCLRCIRDGDIEIAPIYENHPAHIRIDDKSAGTARKPDDDNCIPLCYRHHISDQHGKGERTFHGDELGLNKRTAKSLYAVYDPLDYLPAIMVLEAYSDAVKQNS